MRLIGRHVNTAGRSHVRQTLAPHSEKKRNREIETAISLFLPLFPGLQSASLTMIYTTVLNRGRRSPLDQPPPPPFRRQTR